MAGFVQNVALLDDANESNEIYNHKSQVYHQSRNSDSRRTSVQKHVAEDQVSYIQRLKSLDHRLLPRRRDRASIDISAGGLSGSLAGLAVFHKEPETWWEKFTAWSSETFLGETFRLEGSVIPVVVGPAIMEAAWAAIITFLYQNLGWTWISNKDYNYTGILALVIGLLIVFRNNTGYDRWWNGRQIWTQMITNIRNLSRAVWMSVENESNHPKEGAKNSKSRKLQLMRLTIAFPIAVKHYLRSEHGPDHEDLANLLEETKLRGAPQLGQRPDVLPLPMEIISIITACLIAEKEAKRLDGNSHGAMLGILGSLTDNLSQFEKILRSPMPLAYRIHLRQVTLIFLMLLPIQYASTFVWMCPAASFLVAFTFFGIDRIAGEIENPFGNDANDLPQDLYCETLRNEIEAMMVQYESLPNGIEDAPVQEHAKVEAVLSSIRETATIDNLDDKEIVAGNVTKKSQPNVNTGIESLPNAIVDAPYREHAKVEVVHSSIRSIDHLNEKEIVAGNVTKKSQPNMNSEIQSLPNAIEDAPYNDDEYAKVEPVRSSIRKSAAMDQNETEIVAGNVVKETQSKVNSNAESLPNAMADASLHAKVEAVLSSIRETAIIDYLHEKEIGARHETKTSQANVNADVESLPYVIEDAKVESVLSSIGSIDSLNQKEIVAGHVTRKSETNDNADIESLPSSIEDATLNDNEHAKLEAAVRSSTSIRETATIDQLNETEIVAGNETKK